MSLDIISAGDDSKFIETWAARKARIAAERAGQSGQKIAQPRGERRVAAVASAPYRDRVIALYGLASKTVVAERFGLTPNQVNGIWCKEQRAGRLPRLFGRFDGAKSTYTQATRKNGRVIDGAGAPAEVRP